MIVKSIKFDDEVMNKLSDTSIHVREADRYQVSGNGPEPDGRVPD